MDSQGPPDKAKWWTNRRRMAWTALLSGVILFPVLALVNAEIIGFAGAFYTFVGAVVVSYIGTALIDDKGWPGGKT